MEPAAEATGSLPQGAYVLDARGVTAGGRERWLCEQGEEYVTLLGPVFLLPQCSRVEEQWVAPKISFKRWVCKEEERKHPTGGLEGSSMRQGVVEDPQGRPIPSPTVLVQRTGQRERRAGRALT